MIINILLLLILIVLNGFLSMSEFAIVSARKGKLHKLAKEGNKNAKRVLNLTEDPNQFLSTIQIGITLIGILTGAIGGTTLSDPLAAVLYPYIPQYSIFVSVLIVVLITTYLTLIIGELVPKRIGLNNPEAMALKVVKPMKILYKLCGPLVSILSESTNFVLWVMGIKNTRKTKVTEEEIELLIKEGIADGTIEQEEEDIIKRVFKLDDQKVDMIMTPRKEIIWIDLNESKEEMYKKIIASERSIFPVARENLDDFIGVVQAKDILSSLFKGEKLDIEKIIKDPLVVPEHILSLDLLKQFKENTEYVHMSLVIDEFGNLEGLITLNDLLEGIVGDIPGIDEFDEPSAFQRDDGTWLIDGIYPIEKFRELFKFDEDFPFEKEDGFTTLAGFILSYIGKIPEIGEKFKWERFCMEIIDMDGHQIDKILLEELEPEVSEVKDE